VTPGPAIEVVGPADAPLAYVVRASATADATTFLTDEAESLQAGFVVHAAGDDVPRHFHRPLERRLIGTAEVVLVRSGRCAVDLYDEDLQLAESRELAPGDLVVLLRGGHGFRMLEDAVLFEVKQGPYTGIDEKEWF
jgi:hypothetical protein